MRFEFLPKYLVFVFALFLVVVLFIINDINITVFKYEKNVQISDLNSLACCFWWCTIDYAFHLNLFYRNAEVRTKDGDIAVVKYTDLDTMDNPVSFAGTHWYLRATKQFLYAQGPTNQEVIIKVSIGI